MALIILLSVGIMVGTRDYFYVLTPYPVYNPVLVVYPSAPIPRKVVFQRFGFPDSCGLSVADNISYELVYPA